MSGSFMPQAGQQPATSPMGSTPGQPLYGQQQQMDPQTAAVIAQMQAMGKQPQGNAMGLDSNLLAAALDHYALMNKQQPGAPVAANNSGGDPTNGAAASSLASMTGAAPQGQAPGQGGQSIGAMLSQLWGAG